MLVALSSFHRCKDGGGRMTELPEQWPREEKGLSSSSSFPGRERKEGKGQVNSVHNTGYS